MDIIEQISTIVSNTENSLQCNKKILDILKNKKKYYVEQFVTATEVEKKAEANIIKDNRYYKCDVFNAFYSLYNSEKMKDTEEGELKILNSYSHIKYFILIENNFNIRFFISQITNLLLEGNISSDNKETDSIKHLTTTDIAYEITREELEKIDNLFKGENYGE